MLGARFAWRPTILASLVPFPPGLAAGIAVVLLAIFVPLIRGCGWKTAAVLATVAAAMTFVGPLTGWLVETYSTGREGGESVRATGLDSQLDGGFLGGYVMGLALLSMLVGVAVAVRETPAPTREVLGLTATLALALTSATALVALDLLRIGGVSEYVSGRPPEYQISRTEGAGVGIWLTLFAALFGAYSAIGLLLKVRAQARRDSEPPRSPRGTSTTDRGGLMD